MRGQDDTWSVRGTIVHDLQSDGIEGSTSWLIVPTELGSVWVNRWLHFQDSAEDYTELRFIYGGAVHLRRFRKWYSNQYCVTLAKRFAWEKGGG